MNGSADLDCTQTASIRSIGQYISYVLIVPFMWRQNGNSSRTLTKVFYHPEASLQFSGQDVPRGSKLTDVNLGFLNEKVGEILFMSCKMMIYSW